jgi:hypothetical protein
MIVLATRVGAETNELTGANEDDPLSRRAAELGLETEHNCRARNLVIKTGGDATYSLPWHWADGR